jgi:regulator of sigma E protease
LLTILAFAFVLGVLVFVHELGHFLAAKRVGITVLKFQLGFNPTILSFKRGDTEYSIGALPLGGYVKMAGESPDEGRTGQPDEFLSKSKWERFQVLVMGPVMNLALAVFLLAVVLYQGAEMPIYQDLPPVVGFVETASPAEQVGIEPGDRVVAVAGRQVDTWSAFVIGVGTRSNREIELKLLRGGQEITRMVTPVPDADSRFEIGDIGVLPDTHPVIRSVNPGDPADRDGVEAGDLILAADGEPVIFQYQFRDIIAKHPEEEMALTVERNGETVELTVTPDRRGQIGYLGVVPADQSVSIKPGLVQALRMSVDQNVEMSLLILHTIWDLIRREIPPSQLMGPVAIAQLSGESAQLGWIALFSLMASISLNLGLLNLLPIPILDGGHITIMALEGVARRDFSIRVKEKMLLAGFVVLMMLMVTVIYNDLARINWIEQLMIWR